LFKALKQGLRIKTFVGTTENAVQTQIWTALIAMLLVKYLQLKLALDASLYQILQILSITLFEKTAILQALQPSDFREDLPDFSNQLDLFRL